MTKQEFIQKINDEIKQGEELLTEFKSIQRLQEDYRHSDSIVVIRTSPRYDSEERAHLESELYIWQTRVNSVLVSFWGDSQAALIDEFKISDTRMWSDFKETGIRVINNNITVLKSYLARLPNLMTATKCIDKTLPYKIFISHSHEDADFAEALVDLLEYMGIKGRDKIFCSSVTEYGVPNSEDIIEYLRTLFETNRLFVILIHSSSYYESHVSLNEMGAAWALGTDFHSFLVKGFDFNKMDGVIDGKYASIKVDAEDAKARLNEFRDKVCSIFGIDKENDTRWERHRDQFIKRVTLG